MEAVKRTTSQDEATSCAVAVLRLATPCHPLPRPSTPARSSHVCDGEARAAQLVDCITRALCMNVYECN